MTVPVTIPSSSLIFAFGLTFLAGCGGGAG